MKASELRIGNKIKFIDDGTIFTVVSIDLKGAGLENTSEFAWIEFESLEPIPLTEDWLLKFGFDEYLSPTDLRIKIASGVLLQFHFGVNKTECWIGDEISRPNLIYVHQLQNLYHALTGEELTIK